MSDEASARLSLPFLSSGQAQKEVTHNEALQRLDLLVQPVALSASVSTPPPSPDEGACWIVGPSPDGGWAGHAGDIAQWTAGGWRFAQPSAGWECHVLDRAGTMRFDGSARWRGARRWTLRGGRARSGGAAGGDHGAERRERGGQRGEDGHHRNPGRAAGPWFNLIVRQHMLVCLYGITKARKIT
jgi:hypothetical protein